MVIAICQVGCGGIPAPTPLPDPPPAVPGSGGGGGGLVAPPSDGRLYGMKNAAWVLIPQSQVMEYSYNDTVAQPPAGGQVRFNNINPTAATLMWISGVTAPGAATLTVLKQLGNGIGLYVQDKDDSARWAAYNVMGNAVDKGTYVEVPVQFVQGLGTLPAGQRVTITNTTKFV